MMPQPVQVGEVGCANTYLRYLHLEDDQMGGKNPINI